MEQSSRFFIRLKRDEKIRNYVLPRMHADIEGVSELSDQLPFYSPWTGESVSMGNFELASMNTDIV